MRYSAVCPAPRGSNEKNLASGKGIWHSGHHEMREKRFDAPTYGPVAAEQPRVF